MIHEIHEEVHEIAEEPAPLLEVTDLKQYFTVHSGLFTKHMFRALDGVSFSLFRGETLGIIGETGSGKTTLARSIFRLDIPTGGTVRFGGQMITDDNIQSARRRMQLIFQDSYSSLNPRMTAADIIAEPLLLYKIYGRVEECQARIVDIMNLVGLNRSVQTRFPYELSGGQRQRVAIARAVAADPELIICDEPVSALDVSVSAQILNLLTDIQENTGVSYIFISHNLLTVNHMCDRVAVMYLGRIVEVADAADLSVNPIHPYTTALLSAMPIPDPSLERTRERIILPGEPPSTGDAGAGCPFRGRCGKALGKCASKRPPMTDCGGNHFVACFNL